MKKKMFLFAMICNLFAPPKKVREIVTEWQEPSEDISKTEDYIFAYKKLQVLSDEFTTCCLDVGRFVMVNKKGLVRDFTDEEIRIILLRTREEVRGVK